MKRPLKRNEIGKPRHKELIRQSNHDLELEELEDRHIEEIQKEGLRRLIPIKHGENAHESEKESPLDQPAGEIPF